VAKHPLEATNQHDNGGKASARAVATAKHPSAKKWAAKHPPKNDQCNLDEADRRQTQKRGLSEESGGPPPDAHERGRSVDNKQSFQDDASREGATPQAPTSSDQHGQGFHPEDSPREGR